MRWNNVRPLVRAALALRSHPARVFIEAASYEVVNETVRIFDSLKTGFVRALEVDEAQGCLLSGSSYTPSIGSWIRLGTGTYRGDIGYVRKVDPRSLHADIVVVPRINFDAGKRKRGGRPPRRLFDPEAVRKIWGAESFEKRNNIWYFRHEFYTPDGYHLWNDVDSEFIIPATCFPSRTELNDFDGCSEIPLAIYNATCHHIAAKTLRSGDRILVVDGECKGLEGNVCSTRDEEAEIFIPSQHLLHVLHLTKLRREFKIGDNVRVTFGPHAGTVAFVLNSLNDVLTLYNQETSTEVRDCIFLPTKKLSRDYR